MPKSVRMELRVTPELAAAIDEARGDVSRNVWLERAAEQRLEHEAARQRTAPPVRGFNRVTTLKR